MEAEEILKLFDSNWFEHKKIVTNKLIPPSSPVLESPAPETVHEKESKPYSAPKSLKVRSLSDRYLGVNPSNFFNEESEKQSSSNTRPRLQKIVSGMEMFDFYKEDADSQQKPEKNKWQNKRYRKEKGNISRSLTALEFEELQGFMDLGFVFTEEDKSSNLASILPGLQKLGKNGEVDSKETKEKVEVSRPYLSEAWSVLEQKKLDEDRAAFMKNWRVPSAYNEIYMKNHLRVWAQSVASNFR